MTHGVNPMTAVVRALSSWEHVELARPGGGVLRVTGVPARHGPAGSEHLVGEVTGFLLSGNGLPTVYISGDNAGLDVVAAVASRITAVDVAVLFAGGGDSARPGWPAACIFSSPASGSIFSHSGLIVQLQRREITRAR
jgi:hypothetical protein